MKRRLPVRQRGVAVVTALLLTTLAVTIVASLFWQQQVQVRSIENQRLHVQTRWMLRAGLDLSRFFLREDMRMNPSMTRETDIWATPVAETRLDDLVKHERVEGETYDATVSGRNYDAQSRYNLANLASTAGGGGINKRQLAVFSRLLQMLQLDQSLAKAVAIQVARGEGVGQVQQQGQPPSPDVEPVPPAGGMPMKMLRVEDLLAVAGFDQKAIEKLRDFVVVLPKATPVNVNTAPAELLAALFNGSVSEGQNLVVNRKRTAFTDVANFKAFVHGKELLLQDSDLSVRSDYFLLWSRVHLERAELKTWSLIQREPTGIKVIWVREI